jgi:hypothetical protein
MKRIGALRAIEAGDAEAAGAAMRGNPLRAQRLLGLATDSLAECQGCPADFLG